MIFCTKCGNELADDVRFCVKCGQKIKVVENITTVTVNVEPEIKKSNKKVGVLIVSIVAVLLLIAFMMFSIFATLIGGNKNQIANYSGNYTCVSANAAYVNRHEYQNVAKLYITKKNIEWEGNFIYKEAKIDEFEYMGNSGVSWVDGNEFYNDFTDEFLPFESYEYYVCEDKEIGLVVGKLTSGDVTIVELANFNGTDPMNWAYEMTFQKK